MLFKKTQAKRPPLKRKPPRNPGESLDHEIGRLFEEELLTYALLALYGLLFAALEWWRWFTQSPPQPQFWTAYALLLTAFATYKFLKMRQIIPKLQLGVDGEKEVGHRLEDLRAKGCLIFHDILGDRFNIDHVIVSPRGIFLVETKTYSKPSRGNPTIQFDGQKILIGGRESDRDGVKQVLALRDWLETLFKERTSHEFPVRAVIVYPGWWVEPMNGHKRKDLWVLNPGALPSFIEQEPVVMNADEMASAAAALRDYMETCQR